MIAFLLNLLVAFSPLIPQTALAQRLPPGTPGCPVTTAQPYRSPSVNTVFMVSPDCTKRPIFNPDVYFSHFDDWNKVVFLEQYEMDAISNHRLNFLPWGPRRAFGNGSLVKTTDDPRVYLVTDGEAHPIESEQAFTSLGFNLNQIEDVDAAVLASFRKESVAIKGLNDLPPSTVFKYVDDPKVYVLKKENGVEVKEYIPTYETLKEIGRADRIVILPRDHTFPDKPKPRPTEPKPTPEPKPVPVPDTIVPTVSLSAPDAGSTVSGTITVKANVTDNAGVAYARFYLDAAVLKTDETSPYEATLETGAYTNGTHYVSVLARDTSGNIATTTRSIIIANTSPVPETPTSTKDVTPPTVSFVAPTNSASVNGTVSLQAEAADANGIASVQFKIGSTLLATDTSTPYSASLDTSGYANGDYTLTAIATDIAGNIETATRAITIANTVTPPADVTAPVVSFTSPSSNGTTVSGALSIAVTASDAVGISSVQFKIGSTVLAEDSDSPYGLSLDTTAFTNGAYTLTAIALDAAGNQGMITRTVNILNVVVPPPDTSAPSLLITSPTSGATVGGTISIDATASDNVGVSSVQFKVGSTVISTDTSTPFSASLNTTSLSDGPLTITAVAADAVGNMTTVTRTVNVSNVVVPPPDITNPSAVFTAPASGATVSGSLTISTNASDNIGVTSVQFKVGSIIIGTDTTAPYSATLDTTTLINGPVTLTAIATDAAGNQGSVTRSVTVSNVAPPTPDVTVPTVSFTAPANGATVNGAVTVSASASDNVGVSSVQFKIGSTVIATDSSSPYSAAFDSTAYANSAYTLTIVATDAAGNQGIATRNVTISNVAALPAVKIVVLGASTAAGKNLNPADGYGGPGVSQSWVNRLAAQLAIDRPGSTVQNFAVAGYTTYEVLPTGTSNPAGRPAVDTGHNITAAIATNPNAIIIAMPSITYGANEAMANLVTLYAAASNAGIPTWVATTQPVIGDTSANDAVRLDMNTRITQAYGSHAIDFWNPLLGTGTSASPSLLLSDNAHPNANGHLALYQTVMAKNIPANLSVLAPVTPAPAPTPTPTSTPATLPITDDFNDNSLHSRWTVSNPVGSVAETGGKLNITVPSASNGDWWATTEFAPAVSTALPSGDLEVTVKLETGNFILGTHSGILLWLDRDNAYFFGRVRNGIDTKNGLSLDKVVGSVGQGGICSDSVTTLPMYLRVKRTGSTYEFQSSTNGSVWTVFCTQTSLGFAPDKAGLFLKKWLTGSGDVTMTFDDFSITAPTASPVPTPDATAPTVSFTAPASGATVNGTIAIDATASDNIGVASVQFRIGSTTISTDTTSPYGASLNTATLANGSHTLTVVATDAAGNTGTATRTITVSNTTSDVTAPTVSFTSPASDGSTVSGSITLQASASDAVGVTNVQFKIGANSIANDNSSPYAATFDTTSYANGAYTLSAVVTDAAGNSATANRTVTISNQAQTPPVQAALNNCYTDTGADGSSAINLTLTPSRTTGVAPLSVYFETLGTTAQAASRPFHDLAYCWDFGDSGAGTFSMSGKSKNRAYGPAAAHVFETPGTYTVNLNARDNQGRVAAKAVQIVVTDPTSVFTASNTVCLSGTGDFSGCPAGAKQVTNTSIGALNTEIAGAGGKRRILIHRGESYTGGIRIDETGPGLIGTYGSGAVPLISTTGRAFDFSDQDLATVNNPNEAYPTDWRIMDMDVDGLANGNSLGVYIGGLTKNVLALRVRVRNAGGGFGGGDSIINYWNNNGNPGHDVIDGFAIQDSEARDCEGGEGHGLIGIAGRRLSMQGNYFNNSEKCEHVIRTFDLDRAVISNNDIGRTAVGKSLLKLHNSGFTVSNHLFYQKPSERIVIADNTFRSGVEDWSVGIGPQNSNTDERVQNVLFERNIFTPGSKTQIPLVLWAEDVTVQNNIFQNGNARDCVGIQRRGIEPNPARVNVFHNTCVGTNPAGTHIVSVLGAYAGINVANNLTVGATPRVTFDGELTRFTNVNNVLQTNLASVFVSGSPSTATDYKLRSSTPVSPAVGAGNASYATPWDYFMVPRAFGTGAAVPDVGAWKF